MKTAYPYHVKVRDLKPGMIIERPPASDSEPPRNVTIKRVDKFASFGRLGYDYFDENGVVGSTEAPLDGNRTVVGRATKTATEA